MSTTTWPMAAAEGEPGFLAGLRVLELGDRLAAGTCGTLLAQLGAQVVLVEPPEPRGDAKWACRPVIAAGKQSIVIDRHSPEGADELRTLLHNSDVVLLSTDADAAELAIWQGKRSPSQILCDITAYGHSGPLAGRGGSEALVQAYAAVAETMGNADGPPGLIGFPILDMQAAVYAASAVIAARRVQRRLRIGQRVEVSLYDVGINALLTFIPLHTIGRTTKRNGNRHPTLVPWNAYRAQDGWVCICGPTDDQWRRLCGLVGRPEFVGDPRFSTPSARMDNVAEVDALLAEWAGTMTVEECVSRLTGAGIPGGSIVAIDRLHEERNLAHRRAIQSLHDPVSDRMVRVPACPIRVRGKAPLAASIPAPDADRARILQRLRAAGPASDPSSGDARTGRRPLEGVRVVEIGMNTVAPLACRQLGALGADVVKVEPPGGDTNRWNAPVHACGEGYVYALSNADKRGLILNLRDDGDREVLFRLLATADMVIENLKPGSLDKLGAGPNEVVRRFPDIIYCSVNGFGNDSAYPGRPALDTVIQGMAGVMSASVIDGVPTKAGISVSDQLGGQFSLLAMLAALERRETTGRGANFDIAMQDCSAWATQFVWDGRPVSPCAIHATRDGYVALEGDLATVRQALGLAPGANLSNALASISREEAVARLALVPGTDCAPVLTFAEVMDHAQLRARALIVERVAADGLGWQLLASPMRLETTPAEVRAPMPQLGYLDARLAEELGLPLRDSIQVRSPANARQRQRVAEGEATTQEKA